MEHQDYYRERFASHYDEIGDDLTPEERDSVKDGYSPLTDWSTPENQNLYKQLIERKRRDKQRHRVQTATERALSDWRNMMAVDKKLQQEKLVKEKGTYQERFNEFIGGEEASKRRLKEEILAIKNPQERFRKIAENADLFRP